jgi:hypothetical protein
MKNIPWLLKIRPLILPDQLRALSQRRHPRHDRFSIDYVLRLETEVTTLRADYAML